MGGVARSELAAAVSAAGGYGFLGMVREPPELISEEIRRVRAATDRPFGVNLIPGATDPALFAEELAVCLETRVHSLCFFWTVDADAVARARAAGCRVVYQVGSVADAIAAERAGAQAVIAQGFEAGGHVRGTTSSLVLIPAVAAAVSIPVVACGGFATGAGLAAALALGAHGIHCGTAFLATRESFAHDYHKTRILEARAEDTVHTDVFAVNWPAGSPVRVIGNAITERYRDRPLGHTPEEYPREIIAYENDRPIPRYSTDSPLRITTGKLEEMPLFAGQVTELIDDIPTAAERLLDIVAEAETTLGRLAGGDAPGLDDVSASAEPSSPTCLLSAMEDPVFAGYLSKADIAELLAQTTADLSACRNALDENGAATAIALDAMGTTLAVLRTGSPQAADPPSPAGDPAALLQRARARLSDALLRLDDNAAITQPLRELRDQLNRLTAR